MCLLLQSNRPARWRVCVATAMFVGCCCGSKVTAQKVANDVAQQPGQVQSPEQPGTSALRQGTGQANERQQLIELLVKEMSDLIPMAAGQASPHQDTLVKIATTFVDGDRKTSAQLIKQLATNDADCPPEGLLMAGLSYAVNDPARGHQLLEQTALSHPKYPGVYTAFARLAINQGRFTDARALLEKAKRLIDDQQLGPKAGNHYQLQYLDAMAEVSTRQRRTDDAIRYVAELEKIAPENPKVLLSRAEIEFQKKNVDGSLEYLSKFRQKMPNSRPPELVVASWFQQTGDVQNADKWVKKAAESYPGDAIVQMEYANWSLSREDFHAASIALGQVEKTAGELPATKAMKGKIAFAQQAYAVAESHFATLFSSQPNNFDLANMYALSLIESSDAGKRDKAKQIAMRNLQALPDNPIAQAAMGWVFLKAGESEQAKSLLTRASRAPELSPEVAYFLASFMHQSGDSARAKMVLEPAMEGQGLFLYRSSARALMAKIENTSSQLPDPSK